MKAGYPSPAGWMERVLENTVHKCLNPGSSAPMLSGLTAQPQCVRPSWVGTWSYVIRSYSLMIHGVSMGGIE